MTEVEEIDARCDAQAIIEMADQLDDERDPEAIGIRLHVIRTMCTDLLKKLQ